VKGSVDSVEDTAWILKHVIVPETQDGETLRLQERIAANIALAVRVLSRQLQ